MLIYAAKTHLYLRRKMAIFFWANFFKKWQICAAVIREKLGKKRFLISVWLTPVRHENSLIAHR
jgi:hypothetical protein